MGSGLLTDLYQLSMAYGYWQSGMAKREAIFHLFFRRAPFGGSYALAAGLEGVARHLEAFGFEDDELEYLQSLGGTDGESLFSAEFLEMLSRLSLSCDIDAAPEGSVVFPHEPILRVRGPLLECQLLETPLLNLINFPTLIATKAARIRQSALGDVVLEFGLRRAHGVDGGLTASRAAYIGGVDATSNVLAGRLFDIPVKGTHAHSWVMAFPSEREAFQAYARAQPNNCIFLVDTYDTRKGVENAIATARELSQAGHEMVGIRLDSGDLVTLSQYARSRLADEGFGEAVIVASGDLDEHSIARLKQEGAEIDVWGVGTKLSTGYPDAALGGVYKLGAVRDKRGIWRYVSKRSENLVKSSIPGNLAVDRFVEDGRYVGDVIYDEEGQRPTCGRHRTLTGEWIQITGTPHHLLRPFTRRGVLIEGNLVAGVARSRALKSLEELPRIYRAIEGKGCFPVGLTAELHQLRERQ